MLNVQFTDRYGPDGPPSWLRGCHADCEAMGFVPVWFDFPGNTSQLRMAPNPQDERYRREWQEQHDARPHECDGYHFVKCPACNGTGRVSLLVSFTRVPRWLVKGARFMWDFRRGEMHPPQWSRWRRFSTLFKCAYLYDLGLRKP